MSHSNGEPKVSTDGRKAATLTITQQEMLADIAETGQPTADEGWAIHSQRTLDSLKVRGLVRYVGGGRYEVVG